LSRQENAIERGTSKLQREDVLKEHDNSVNCRACWQGYPRVCTCGGLIHAEFGDYISRDSYYLEECCDRCGEDYEPVEED